MTMRKFSKKQYLAAGATAALIVGGAGVAFAYWTNSGSGTGSASTGTNTSITVNQTSSVAGLYPGGPAAGLSGNFTNTNSSKVFVHSVTVAIQTGWSSNAVDASQPACTAADFTLGQPGLVDAEVAPGTGGSWSGGSIALNDNPTANQDNCKNVSVPLVYSSN
jgi:hypothetical protein